ncbi:hypothetical protein DAEQUDRAFT_765510 [Daedalea quercina L-15889]|uniref:DUF6535 domain-containing protein n=1 Tax=Daedalea quercina L-15889 TaxID=1314783 RepID=A0A165QGA2_9APHY|nr:hypothetical protein DAEQUDRAFT_765510 [Daedalea quercina L-15889]
MVKADTAPTVRAAETKRPVWAHEEAAVKNWKEEIDTMLVFAGLFSAIVSTFNSQYYTNLQPPPPPVIYYLNLSANVAALAGNTEDWTGTIRAPESATAASIGISVKQWLEHYVAPQNLVPRQRAQIWHSRRRGLLDWRVPEIITLIPLLLQIALALFLVGLQILLWTMSCVVASVVLAPTVLLLVFTVYTAIAPAITSDCPYRSPQAWWIYQVFRRLTQFLALVSKYGLPIGPKLSLLTSRAMQPRATWIDREKAKLRRLRAGESSLDVLVTADKFIGGGTFLDEVVKPCLVHADLHSALPVFYRILEERAQWHLVDTSVGLRSMPKWLADGVDESSVVVMGVLAVEMLHRVEAEGQERDRQYEEPRILDVLGRLLCEMHVTDVVVYERLVVWFVDANLPLKPRKKALALISRNAPKFLGGNPELCVSLGNVCLAMVEMLHRNGSDPQASRQKAILHALDYILSTTPKTLSSLFDRLCMLIHAAGIDQEACDEMVAVVYRYCGHFQSSKKNVLTLSSCMRPLQNAVNPVSAMFLLSAILVMCTTLPNHKVELIENALKSASGDASPETVNAIAQKIARKGAWWVVSKLVDGCVAVAAERDIQLLPPTALRALISLVSLCDALAALSNGVVLLGIRQRIQLLRDILEGNVKP